MLHLELTITWNDLAAFAAVACLVLAAALVIWCFGSFPGKELLAPREVRKVRGAIAGFQLAPSPTST
jgi:hypothetical protein